MPPYDDPLDVLKDEEQWDRDQDDLWDNYCEPDDEPYDNDPNWDHE